MLFRRHLDGEVEQSAPSSVAPEADESSNLELSPEEISQSLFGDLTEVFEDSLHHYMQNRQASQAPEMEHSAFVAEDPVPQDVVEHESGSDDDGVELSESLLEVRPPEPADNKASLSLGAEDLPEPPLAAKSDSEESLVSTLDQALSTPLGEALKAAQEEAEVQALLKQAPATAGNEAVEEQSVPADTDPFERIESSLVRAADPVEDPMVEVSTPLTDEGEPISQSSLSDDDDAREDSEIRASDGLPEPSASESAELQESSDAEDAEGACSG